MKRKGLILSIGLALLLGFSTASAQAQVYNPLAFGALGTALGFAAGGNAASAAIGGAAGVGAGILMNASTAHGYYGRPYAVGVHYPGYGYYGHRPYYDRWAYRYPHRGWYPGYYNDHRRGWNSSYNGDHRHRPWHSANSSRYGHANSGYYGR